MRKARAGGILHSMEYMPTVTWKASLSFRHLNQGGRFSYAAEQGGRFVFILVASLCGGAVWGSKHQEKDAAVNSFCTHCQCCTQAKDALPFLWVWDIGVLDMAVLMPTTRISWGLHSFLTRSLRNFVHCSNGYDTGTHRLAGLSHLLRASVRKLHSVKVLKLSEAREGLFCHHALHMPL